MKILNKDNIEIINPDFSIGYLIDDKILIKHHAAIPEIKEKFHYEIATIYPNGGKDLEKIIDIPGQKFTASWDEYENIQRYVEYTPEELEQRNSPTQLDRLEAQITYIAMKMDLLLEKMSPMTTIQKNKNYTLNEKIIKWFKQKLWTVSMVEEAISKHILTHTEFESVLNEVSK